MLHGNIEYIAMKEPGGFIILQWQNKFVNNPERAHFKTGKFAKHFIMIAGDIIDLNFPAHPMHQVFNHLHVALWPIPLTELPDINNISVEDNSFWFYAFQIE